MKFWRPFLTALILVLLCVPTQLMAQQAQSHVVPLQELQNRLVAKSAQRSQDIQEIQKFLHQDMVQKQAGNLVNLSRVEAALGTMNDETLHQLAATSQSINDDIEAGIATWGAVVMFPPRLKFKRKPESSVSMCQNTNGVEATPSVMNPAACTFPVMDAVCHSPSVIPERS